MVRCAALHRAERSRPLKDPIGAPPRAELERLLDRLAPLTPAPLCPEIRVHRARSLIEVWEAAEALAGETMPSPFWAYPWPGGCALARVVLDSPACVAGLRVLDFGAGGGVTALAAAAAGAEHVSANDLDPWALLVTRIAAEAQGLRVETFRDDICDTPPLVDDYDVVLCSDLAYERSQAPRQRAVLDRAVRNGATVLVADAGRTYFESHGMRLVAEFEIDVPVDVEGQAVRTSRCYRMVPA